MFPCKCLTRALHVPFAPVRKVRILGNPWSATEPRTPYFIGASAKLPADSGFLEDSCSPPGSTYELLAAPGPHGNARSAARPDPSAARVWALFALFRTGAAAGA